MSSEKISDAGIDELIRFFEGDAHIVAAFKELQSSRRKLKQCEEIEASLITILDKAQRTLAGLSVSYPTRVRELDGSIKTVYEIDSIGLVANELNDALAALRSSK